MTTDPVSGLSDSTATGIPSAAESASNQSNISAVTQSVFENTQTVAQTSLQNVTLPNQKETIPVGVFLLDGRCPLFEKYLKEYLEEEYGQEITQINQKLGKESFNASPSPQIYVYREVIMTPGSKFPSKGEWAIKLLPNSNEPSAKTLHLMYTAQKKFFFFNAKPALFPIIGDTQATPQLLLDVWAFLKIKAPLFLRVSQGYILSGTCREVEDSFMVVDVDQIGEGKRWEEKWIIRVYEKEVLVHILFTPDRQGKIYFSIEEAAPLDRYFTTHAFPLGRINRVASSSNQKETIPVGLFLWDGQHPLFENYLRESLKTEYETEGEEINRKVGKKVFNPSTTGMCQVYVHQEIDMSSKSPLPSSGAWTIEVPFTSIKDTPNILNLVHMAQKGPSQSKEKSLLFSFIGNTLVTPHYLLALLPVLKQFVRSRLDPQLLNEAAFEDTFVIICVEGETWITKACGKTIAAKVTHKLDQYGGIDFTIE